MSKISKFIKDQFPGFIIAVFVTLIGIYLTVGFDNANSETLDTKTAIALLQTASEDLAVQAKSLENMVGDSGSNLDSIDSYEDLINLRDSLDQFEFSGIEIPYPVTFDKAIDDHKVYSRLSSTGRRSVYRIQESLRKEKSYILGESNGMQEFLTANEDYPSFAFEDPAEATKYVDSYVRMINLKQYKKHLDVLSSILKIQVEYIQKDITEDEANTRTSDVEIEAFKPESTPLEQENRLKELERIKELLRQFTLENSQPI